jgi:hypothetical protein
MAITGFSPGSAPISTPKSVAPNIAAIGPALKTAAAAFRKKSISAVPPHT